MYAESNNVYGGCSRAQLVWVSLGELLKMYWYGQTVFMLASMLWTATHIQHGVCHHACCMHGRQVQVVRLMQSSDGGWLYEVGDCTAFGPCSARHIIPTSLLVCVVRDRY